MHLKLLDLNTSIRVGSLVEVVLRASTVSRQVHLANYILADFGQVILLGQYLASQLMKLNSQTVWH